MRCFDGNGISQRCLFLDFIFFFSVIVLVEFVSGDGQTEFYIFAEIIHAKTKDDEKLS